MHPRHQGVQLLAQSVVVEGHTRSMPALHLDGQADPRANYMVWRRLLSQHDYRQRADRLTDRA